MKNKTLLLPGFHLPTLRRKPRSEPQRLAERLQLIREKSISQLHDCFGAFIPNTLLQTATSGTFSRQRLFTKANTFWGFFTQILNADGGCQEVVLTIGEVAKKAGVGVETVRFYQREGLITEPPPQTDKWLSHQPPPPRSHRKTTIHPWCQGTWFHVVGNRDTAGN